MSNNIRNFFRKISGKLASIFSIALVFTLISVPLTQSYSISYEAKTLTNNLVRANDQIMGPNQVTIDLKQTYSDDTLPTYLVLNASTNVNLVAGYGTSLPEGLSVKKTTTDADGITSFVLVPDNNVLMPGDYTFNLRAVDGTTTYAETGNITLTVLPAHVESINITSANSIEVNEGDSYQLMLTATVNPSNANQDVNWFLQTGSHGITLGENGLLIIPNNIDASTFEIVVGCVSQDTNYQNQPVQQTQTITITIKKVYATSISLSSPGDIDFVYLDNSNWSYKFSYSLTPETATTDTTIKYYWVNNNSIPGMELSQDGLLSVSDTNLLLPGSYIGQVGISYLNEETGNLITNSSEINVNVEYASVESISITNLQENDHISGTFGRDWSFTPQAVANPFNSNQDIEWSLKSTEVSGNWDVFFTCNQDNGEIKLSDYAFTNFYSDLVDFLIPLTLTVTSKQDSTISTSVSFFVDFERPELESFTIDVSNSETNIQKDISLNNNYISITDVFPTNIEPFAANVGYDTEIIISGQDAQYFDTVVKPSGDSSSFLCELRINTSSNSQFLKDFKSIVDQRDLHITISASKTSSSGTMINSTNSIDLTIGLHYQQPISIDVFTDSDHSNELEDNQTFNVNIGDSTPFLVLYPMVNPDWSNQDLLNLSIVGTQEQQNQFTLTSNEYYYDTKVYLNYYEIKLSNKVTEIGTYPLTLKFELTEQSISRTFNFIVEVSNSEVESITIDSNIKNDYTIHLSDQFEIPLKATVNPVGSNQTVDWTMIGSSDYFIIDKNNSVPYLRYLENAEIEFDEIITIMVKSQSNQDITNQISITFHFIYDELESLTINGDNEFNVDYGYNQIITNFTISTTPSKANPNVVWSLINYNQYFQISNDGYLSIKQNSNLPSGNYNIVLVARSVIDNAIFAQKNITIKYYSNPESVSISGISQNQEFSIVEGNSQVFATATAQVNPSTAKQEVNWTLSIADIDDPTTVFNINQNSTSISFALKNNVATGEKFFCTLTAKTNLDNNNKTKQASVSFNVFVTNSLAPTSLKIENVDSNYEIYNDFEDVIISPQVTVQPIDASNQVIWSLQQSYDDFAIDNATGNVTLINEKLINVTRTIAITATSIYDNSVSDTVTTTIKVLENAIVPISIDITNITENQQFDAYIDDYSVIVKAQASIDPITASKNVQWTLGGPNSNEFSLDHYSGELTLQFNATVGVKELIINVESTIDPKINDRVKIIVNVLEKQPEDTNLLVIIMSICIPLVIAIIVIVIILTIYFSKKNKNKNRR